MADDLLERPASPRLTSIVTTIALLAFLPLLLIGVYQAVTIITRAAGIPANIIVDASNTLEPITTDFYHAFAQGGEESKDMIAPVVDQVRQLRPQLIRLDHLYDHYDVVGRSGSDLTFNWDKLDAAVNSILGTGAKPLLALSFMPSVIAKDGNIINPPNNWDEWATVVQRTIEHYSGKGGKNLSGIYYEVWNEPDLDIFGKWKLSGDKNYLTLYRYASIGASRAQNVNYFFLGGPATTGLYQNWIISLITSGNRVDFLSWHSYLSDPKRFNDDQRNIASWLLPYPNYVLIPKLITEFGFTGNKSQGYGTTYAAAFTAATIRQLISGKPTYAFSFQLVDGPNQGQTADGWGLITHGDNGQKPKPRYYVYNFLDPMAGTRLGLSGEGTWITGFSTVRDTTIRLMLVNFDCCGNHVETVPITITNIQPGTYKYREHILFGRDVTITETLTAPAFTRQIYMPTQSILEMELTRQ